MTDEYPKDCCHGLPYDEHCSWCEDDERGDQEYTRWREDQDRYEEGQDE